LLRATREEGGSGLSTDAGRGGSGQVFDGGTAMLTVGHVRAHFHVVDLTRFPHVGVGLGSNFGPRDVEHRSGRGAFGRLSVDRDVHSGACEDCVEGRGEPTPFMGTVPELLTMLVKDVAFVLTPA
jgi:hypothetical protein